MNPGDIVAERFVIAGFAGAGGMGTVYRAVDRTTDAEVALKLLTRGSADRFLREARLLAEIANPHVVRYVAHGLVHADEPYLAMEWLQGEDLHARLARGPLPVGDAVRLVGDAAGALGAAHERGVVHRDLKPSNLYLVDGDPSRVKVLDFGAARDDRTDATRTADGILLGTPGYMAPEQVRGEPPVDARADVFALGCVLFECVTGRPAFVAQHVVALLGKILLEHPPLLRELLPQAARALEELLASMLAKEPSARPADGRALADALARVGARTTGASVTPSSPSREHVTARERRVVTVILTSPSEGVPLVAASAAAAGMGLSPERLKEGHLWVVAPAGGNARDQAAIAARAARAMRSAAPDVTVVVATGRADMASRLPVGEAMDRAASVLAAALPEKAAFVDEVTASLLEGRFELAASAGGLRLGRESEAVEPSRVLLGKATPYVGRDREMRSVLDAFAECVEEPVARVLLVTAPAGAGKTRLRQEAAGALQRSSESVALWTASASAMTAGSPFAILATMLRRVLPVREDGTDADRREALRSRVAAYVAAERVAEVSALVGELVGVPFPDDTTPLLRAARRDAMAMTELMLRAAVDLLTADLRAHPVVILLDDLQWADAPSLRFVDEALRDAHDLPLLVLGLARPEVHDAFPRLWVDRGLHELRLAPLTPKACTRLARFVLGDAASAEAVDRVVARSEGNAFFLEELIRAAAGGGIEALPDTVIAMVQARFEKLGTEARRVLRAASVFGETFWTRGVAALVGPTAEPLDAVLASLERAEMVVSSPASRFHGERELGFRHALVREAAYAALTEEDRTLAHSEAGVWLEGAGEGDHVVLAEHAERSGDGARASQHYARAARISFRRADIPNAIGRAKRGLRCAVDDETRSVLQAVQAEASFWRGRCADAFGHAQEAMRLSPRWSDPWCRGLTMSIAAAQHLGDLRAANEGLDVFRGPVEVSARNARVLFAALPAIYMSGDLLLAEKWMRFVEPELEAAAMGDVRARAWLGFLQSTRVGVGGGDQWASLMHLRRSIACYAEFQDWHRVTMLSFHQATVLVQFGLFAQAAQVAASSMKLRERHGMVVMIGGARGALLASRALSGEQEDPRGELLDLIEKAGSGPGQSLIEQAYLRSHLLQVLQHRGEWDALVRQAELCLDGRYLPYLRMAGRAWLSLGLLQLGKPEEARTSAREAARLSAHGLWGLTFYARLALGESLCATDDEEGGRRVLAEGRALLLDRAARIDDTEARHAYLHNVWAHARLLDLTGGRPASLP